MPFFQTGSTFLKTYINSQFSNKEPWQIVTITSTSILAGVWLWGFIFQAESELFSLNYTMNYFIKPKTYNDY